MARTRKRNTTTKQRNTIKKDDVDNIHIRKMVKKNVLNDDDIPIRKMVENLNPRKQSQMEDEVSSSISSNSRPSSSKSNSRRSARLNSKQQDYDNEKQIKNKQKTPNHNEFPESTIQMTHSSNDNNSSAITETTKRRMNSHRRSTRIKEHTSSSTPVPILSASYLNRHDNRKNDLVRRLRKIVDGLSDEDVEAHSPEYPGLAGLAAALVEPEYLHHRDKDVRLYTVLASMEVFYLYAPEPPWNDVEIIRIFEQTIQQLGNLAHCTSASMPNYHHYFRLLEQLAVVKIGVVLVELTRTSDQSKDSTALELLAQLIRTLLNCVHMDHSSEVFSHATAAVSACLEEFDGTVPIPLLDEVLGCISSGPVIQVTNPAFVKATAMLAVSNKKGRKLKNTNLPPRLIQQTNQSYRVAASVIRRCEDRISTPIATLLNGLWNGDANIAEQTNITTDDEDNKENNNDDEDHGASEDKANVFSVIYELHRISPPILTTVIGTVASSLQSPQQAKRLRVTQLLGKLFASTASNMGVKFYPCYKEWTRRTTDVDTDVRHTMITALIQILGNKSNERDLVKDATQCLIHLVKSDPKLEIRTNAIHQICELAANHSSHVSSNLLKAVGNRVSSKDKNERRDAVTGLARLYFQNYVCEFLIQPILQQEDGDDCPLDIILDVIHQNYKRKPMYDDDDNGIHDTVDSYDVEDMYEWIPRLVFESACFTDAMDSEMRNRVIQIIDDVLLGSDIKKGKNMIQLTSTSRAVAAVKVMHSLPQNSNAYQWMQQLLCQRANLQTAVSAYIDARAQERNEGGESALRAQAEALQQLERVASLSSPLNASPPVDLSELLPRIHSFRDKHVFKYLATISTPTHSSMARRRAFEELPQRTKALGKDASIWIKCLARRCAMGNFVQLDVVDTCTKLAQECCSAEEYTSATVFLRYLQVVITIYPPLGGCSSVFTELLELFHDIYPKRSDKQIQRCGLLLSLVEILAAASPAHKPTTTAEENDELVTKVQKQLLEICTDHGEPNQVKFAVQTMVALSSSSSLEDSLLKALLANLDMTNNRLWSTITALSTLIELSPATFAKDATAIQFVLHNIVLPNDNEPITKTLKKTRKGPLSDSCSLLCIGIELLVSHIRSTILYMKSNAGLVEAPSEEHICIIFDTLTSMLSQENERLECQTSSEQAALCQAAAINLLRLCDVRLGLEPKYLSHAMWHRLGQAFLNKDIRQGLIQEWSHMLSGQGAFKASSSTVAAPSLRLMAFVVFCTDSEHRTTLRCITNLRLTSEATMAQCRAMGRKAEKYFDQHVKFQLMPEYVVPYALHLLAFQEESNSNLDMIKRIKKSLKHILEPLVTSLGDGADNISFLLRMTEIIGSRYRPLSLLNECISSDDLSDDNSDPMKKLEIICIAARDVLLKFVKKDIHLTPYPGSIQIPGALFVKRIEQLTPTTTPTSSTKKTTSQTSSSNDKYPETATKSTFSSNYETTEATRFSTSAMAKRKKTKERVSFSPDLDMPTTTNSNDDEDDDNLFQSFDTALEDLPDLPNEKKRISNSNNKRKMSKGDSSFLNNKEESFISALSIDEEAWGSLSPIPQSRSPETSNYTSSNTTTTKYEIDLGKRRRSSRQSTSIGSTSSNKPRPSSSSSESPSPNNHGRKSKNRISIPEKKHTASLSEKEISSKSEAKMKKRAVSSSSSTSKPVAKKKVSVPIRISMGSKSPQSESKPKPLKQKLKRKKNKEIDDLDFFELEDTEDEPSISSPKKTNQSRTSKRKTSKKITVVKKSSGSAKKSIQAKSNSSVSSKASASTRSSSRKLTRSIKEVKKMSKDIESISSFSKGSSSTNPSSRRITRLSKKAIDEENALAEKVNAIDSSSSKGNVSTNQPSRKSARTKKKDVVKINKKAKVSSPSHREKSSSRPPSRRSTRRR